MRSSWVPLLLIVGCSADFRAADDLFANIPAAEDASAAESDAGSHVAAPSDDTERLVEPRPAAPAPTTRLVGENVRQCGRAEGSAKPLQKWLLTRTSPLLSSTRTSTIHLGARVFEGSVGLLPSPVTGTPVETPFALDVDDRVRGEKNQPTASDLEALLQPPQGADTFTSHTGVGGRSLDPLEYFAYLNEATPRRFVAAYARSTVLPGAAFLSNVAVVDGAREGQSYVKEITAAHFIGFAMAVELPDDCAVDALADVLGGVPSGFRLLARPPGGLEEIERVLVREGAVVRVSIVASRRVPEEIEAALATTKCASDDLQACTVLYAAIRRATVGIPLAPFNLDRLLGNEDPAWIVTSYATRTVGASPPDEGR